jgi:hypothetical protein
MPEDLFRRAPLRLVAPATMVAVWLCSAPAFAQGTAPTPVNDREVQAFFNGIARDQQLAEQYPSSAPQAAVTRQAAADTPRPARVQSAPTPTSLDEPLDVVLDDAAIVGDEDKSRMTIAEVPPGPVQTVLLVLASLALLAFASSVLTLAVRELKKDAQERRRTYRRRVKRRDTSTPAHAS